MTHSGAKQMPEMTARTNSSRNWCIPVSFKHCTTHAWSIVYQRHIQTYMPHAMPHIPLSNTNSQQHAHTSLTAILQKASIQVKNLGCPLPSLPLPFNSLPETHTYKHTNIQTYMPCHTYHSQTPTVNNMHTPVQRPSVQVNLAQSQRRQAR